MQTETDHIFNRFAKSIQYSPILWGLIAIHFALFVIVLIQDPSLSQETLRRFGGQHNPDIWNGEYHRLLIAGLLHGGLLHVVLNNISLYSLGRIMEPLLGSRAFLMLYLLSLLAGNIASLNWLHPLSVSIGASGAIMGIAGALFTIILCDNRGRFLRVHPRGRWIFFAMLALIFIVSELLPFINNAAHIGGFVMGITLGLFFWSRIPGEKIPRKLGTALFAVAIVLISLLTARGLLPQGTYFWHLHHGIQAFEKGHSDDIRLHLDKAIKLRREPIAMHYLAEFYFQTERYKQAAAIFAELIKKEPSHFNFWYQWIISLHHSKQSDLAQQSFQRAMERFIKAQTRWSIFSSKPPKHEQVLMETRLLAAHRQEKQAIMLYQRLLEQYPESSIIHNDLAWLLVTAHDPHYRNPTLALKHARFALRHAPERYAAYFDTLASALFLSGHIDEAIQAIKAAKNAPGSPNIMPHLYFQLQRFQKRKSAKN